METPDANTSAPDWLAEIASLKKRVAELENTRPTGNYGLDLANEQDFKALVEHSPDIISRHDHKFRHTYINPAIQRVTGLPPAAFIGKTHDELGMPPDRITQWREANRRVFLTGQPQVVEFDFLTPEGLRYFQSRLVPEFGPDGQEVVAILNFARDITELKAVEQKLRNSLENLHISQEKLRHSQEQLLQSRKLESIGRLAGGIAHDFNNLLTAISGYSDLMLLNMAEDEPIRADLEEILKATERAAQLTHQLLAFSRRQVLQPVVISLNLIVTDINRMLARLISENIELKISLDPNLKLVMADPGQLGQVLLNLAVNSRDAMPHGGRLLIETTNVYLDPANLPSPQFAATPGQYVCLKVSDTGTGMDPETQEHVFEPFFTTKEHGKGTGLGLSTAYGIVTQSGGHISLFSEKGKGTTVLIYLPALEANGQQVNTISPATPAVMTGSETILLVEDETVVRNLANRALSERGYQVLAASNGQEAIDLLENYNGPLDLVLTDVIMPKIGGRSLIESVLARRPGLKVIFISGYTDWTAESREVLRPGQVFLQKPFTTSALLRKVRQVLDNFQ